MRHVYEEGLNFPCVRVQSGRTDARTDPLGRVNIRESHIWYARYRAQIGATQSRRDAAEGAGERYGRETSGDFIEDWMDVRPPADMAAIRALPIGIWS